jgi:hypothetical protein
MIFYRMTTREAKGNIYSISRYGNSPRYSNGTGIDV